MAYKYSSLAEKFFPLPFSRVLSQSSTAYNLSRTRMSTIHIQSIICCVNKKTTLTFVRDFGPRGQGAKGPRDRESQGPKDPSADATCWKPRPDRTNRSRCRASASPDTNARQPDGGTGRAGSRSRAPRSNPGNRCRSSQEEP